MDPFNQSAQAAPGPSSSSSPEGRGWKVSEVMFLLVLGVALAAVVYCGRFAYREGALLEHAKANAQAVVRWAETHAASQVQSKPVTPSPCGAATAAGASEPVAATWQACREALFGPGGPFANMHNPFNPANTVLGIKCERRSAATRGHVLLEKRTPLPPGVIGHAAWSVLENKDVLTQGLMLRVQVCDAGGYVVRVAEVTL